jgi:hypothetical protein
VVERLLAACEYDIELNASPPADAPGRGIAC